MQVSKVLVVDGDRTVRDALVTGLRFLGLEAHGADGAMAARTWLDKDRADVMVLSELLLDGAALDLLPGDLGSGRAATVIIANSPSRVSNYRADVTLLHPVSVGRVIEQVEVLLRSRETTSGSVRCDFGMLSLDLASARLANGDDSVRLGRTEARLLRFFMGYPDRVFSRAQLLERLWPRTVHVEERTIDVHVRRLRLALRALGCADYVQTVRGSGYRLSAMPQ